jgi:hypothetical protein
MDAGLVDTILEVQTSILPGRPYLDVLYGMQLFVNRSPAQFGQVASLIFSNTAYLDIILPDGYTFQTEGGFAGRDTQVIPLPGTLPLMLSGLGGLAWLRWGRNRVDRLATAT